MEIEKKTLTILFTLFFILLASLMYLMIKKDLVQQDTNQKRMQAVDNSKQDNVWPKVEIQTRK